MSEGNVGEYYHWISIIDAGIYCSCSPRDSFTVIDTIQGVNAVTVRLRSYDVVGRGIHEVVT